MDDPQSLCRSVLATDVNNHADHHVRNFSETRCYPSPSIDSAFDDAPGDLEDRWPYGLCQGCLCLPWLFYVIKDNTIMTGQAWCLASIMVGILFCFVLFLPSRWIHLGSKMTLILYIIVWMILKIQSLTKGPLHGSDQTAMWLWSLGSLTGSISMIGHLCGSFSPGEILLCAELLAALFCAGSFPTASLSSHDRLLHRTTELLTVFVIWLYLSSMIVQRWTVHWSARTNEVFISHRRRRLQYYFQISLWIFLSFHLWTMSSFVISLVSFLLASPLRRWIVVYWATVVIIGVSIAQVLQDNVPNIVVRKSFHFLAILVIVPGYFLDAQHLRLSLAGAFGGFCFVEAIRSSRLPKISTKIDRFYADFTDARDRGPIVFSHFSLLLGLAMPIWLAPLVEQEAIKMHLLSMSGVVALGMGDSFAAIIGSRSSNGVMLSTGLLCCRYGRVRFSGQDKSLEGALACFISCMIGWMGLQLVLPISVSQLIVPTVAATIYEATSSQNDNLFLPLYYFTMIAVR